MQANAYQRDEPKLEGTRRIGDGLAGDRARLDSLLYALVAMRHVSRVGFTSTLHGMVTIKERI
jgi:hypothetical protein